MGYDITAFKEGTYQCVDPLARRELLENAPDLAAADASVVAYLHTHMDAFSILVQHGYDWFEHLGASDHDGGVSGTGTAARISVETLRRALQALRDHNPGPLEKTGGHRLDVRGLPDELVLFSPDQAQEWEYRSGQLDCFMSACIAYCETTGHFDILIEFA